MCGSFFNTIDWMTRRGLIAEDSVDPAWLTVPGSVKSPEVWASLQNDRPGARYIGKRVRSKLREHDVAEALNAQHQHDLPEPEALKMSPTCGTGMLRELMEREIDIPAHRLSLWNTAWRQAEAKGRSLRMSLAAQQYERIIGRLPLVHDDLIKQIPESAQIDPVTGMMLRYRLLDPAAEKPERRYIIYSVGPDLCDNDGYLPPPLMGGTLGVDNVILGKGDRLPHPTLGIRTEDELRFLQDTWYGRSD